MQYQLYVVCTVSLFFSFLIIMFNYLLFELYCYVFNTDSGDGIISSLDPNINSQTSCKFVSLMDF